MLRFIKQFRARLHRNNPTPKEYSTVVSNMHIDGYETISFAQWQHPKEEPVKITKDNIDFYKKLGVEGKVIIDIGTHTGDTTIPMGIAAGKKGLVIGLEPNKYVFKVLEENIRLNQSIANIEAYCFAATHQDGDYVFNYSDPSFCNGGYLSEIENKNHNHFFPLDVKGKNLNSFLKEKYLSKIDKISLIKIDAEGYDKEIIKTISDILTIQRPVLMVECYKKLNFDEREELFDVLHKKNYILYRIHDFETLSELKIITREDMHHTKHFEILALHNESELNLFNNQSQTGSV